MKKKILVAPLNWGLGHATRCIPLINALRANNFEPIIASDGMALELLKKEFPDLICLELPGYSINYARKGYLLKLKLLSELPNILKTMKAENVATHHIIENYNIDGIISDNRFGVCSKLVPSVYMTHQMTVLSGNTTWLSTKIHQKIIREFVECWIPDFAGLNNLSGKLGHAKTSGIKSKFIGPLSRFRKLDCEIRYDVMVLLSGPEPQRSILELQLLLEFKNYNGKVLFVKGMVENEPKKKEIGNITIHNYLTGNDVEMALNESELIVCRSGYTSIMDLANLGKKAFFIPTPGQFEQEYLAELFRKKRMVASCNQKDFSLEKLKEADNFKGFIPYDNEVNYTELFQLFERK